MEHKKSPRLDKTKRQGGPRRQSVRVVVGFSHLFCLHGFFKVFRCCAICTGGVEFAKHGGRGLKEQLYNKLCGP